MEQLKLPMTFYPYCEYLGGFKRVRRVLAKANEARQWMQLELKLYLRKLVKGGIAFTLKMPTGREFRVPTLREIGRRVAAPIRRFFDARQ